MAQIKKSDDSPGWYLEKWWGDGLGRVQKAHAVSLERYLYLMRPLCYRVSSPLARVLEIGHHAALA